MALAIRQKLRAKGRLTATLIAILAFVMQPLYGLAASQTANAVAASVVSNSLAAWDTSDTSTDGSGHNQITGDGLHVWTDATGHRKAAGYYNIADYPLSAETATTSSAITFAAGGSGSAPSAQLEVDLDGNGTVDGYIVGEKVYSGDTWWLSPYSSTGIQRYSGGSCAPVTPLVSSNGYCNTGTIAQFAGAFPNAKVTRIGYSLGSGVTGDQTVAKITLGGTDFIFSLPAPVPPTVAIATPAENGVVRTKANGNKLAIQGTFTDDVKANYLTLQLVYKGNSKAIGTVYGYGSVYNPAATYADVNGNFTYNLAVPAGLEDGEYSLFYTGTDFTGGVTSRMERTFSIDNTSPTIENVSVDKALTNEGTIRVNGKVFDEHLKDYNLRVYNSDKSAQVSPGIAFTGTANTDGTLAELNVAGLSDGQYWVRIWADDTAGNRAGISSHIYVPFTVDRTAPVAPTLETPANNATINTNDFWFTWSTVSDAVSYEWHGSTDPHTDGDGKLDQGFMWDGDYTQAQPTEPKAHSVGASGTWYWQVRAVDAAGNKSAWTTPWAITIDLNAPTGNEGTNPGTTPGGSNSAPNTDGTDTPETPTAESVPENNPSQLGIVAQLPFASIITGNGDTAPTPTPATNNTKSDVLGDQDKEKGTPLSDTGEVLGIMDHKLFGIAWYWYLVGLVALIAAWLMLAAAIRRRKSEA